MGWINKENTVKKFWQDGNSKNARQAFSEGLYTGLKLPSAKERKLNVTHIGNESGFAGGGPFTFVFKKTVFKDWFSQIIDLIPDGSVIVMDNTSYHSNLGLAEKGHPILDDRKKHFTSKRR